MAASSRSCGWSRARPSSTGPWVPSAMRSRREPASTRARASSRATLGWCCPPGSNSPVVHARHTHSSRHKNRLWTVFVLTLGFLVIEVVAAVRTGSLSLLADAAHMLVDTGGLLMSLFALWFAERPATPAKTYGYYRVEILAALV